MKPSRVLAKLREGKPALVTSVTPVASPKFTELIGLLDIDAVWLDMEHQDYDWHEMANCCLGCRAGGCDAMIRVRKEGMHSYFRALEVGAHGIMAPHCMSADEARDVVRNARFAPVGRRGMDGIEAPADHSLMPMAEYMDMANRETFIALQIEDIESLEAVDEIAAVKGYDILFVGPGDLSQALGVPLEFDHPKMRDAFKRVARAAEANGKWWGSTTGTEERMRELLDMGALFVTQGSVIRMVVEGYTRVKENFDRAVNAWSATGK